MAVAGSLVGSMTTPATGRSVDFPTVLKSNERAVSYLQGVSANAVSLEISVRLVIVLDCQLYSWVKTIDFLFPVAACIAH